MMYILIGIFAAVIGVALLKYGPQMANMHPRHSVFAYRLSGVVCIISAGMSVVCAMGIMKL